MKVTEINYDEEKGMLYTLEDGRIIVLKVFGGYNGIEDLQWAELEPTSPLNGEKE